MDTSLVYNSTIAQYYNIITVPNILLHTEPKEVSLG